MKQALKKLGYLLVANEYYVTRTTLYSVVSMIANFLWAAIKLVLGIWSKSYFLCVSAGFTLCLGVCKMIYLNGHKEGQEERKYIVAIGWVLSIGSLCYIGYMMKLFFLPEVSRDYGIIISITIALVAFLKLFFAIKGIIKMRRQNEPLIATLKGVSFSGALSNIVLTQFCLLEANKNSASFSNDSISFFNALTGTIAGIISLVIGAVIVINTMRKNKINQ